MPLFRRKRQHDGGREAGLRPSAPSEQEVGERALCLGALTALAAAAYDVREQTVERDQGEGFAAEVDGWVRSAGLKDKQSGRERKLFERPLARWSDRDVLDASWRTESLGALLWALSLVEDLPPYDQQFEDVSSLVPVLEPVERFFRNIVLRPASEIEQARDLAELWHWRSRTTQLENDEDFTRSNPGIDLDEIVRETARAAGKQGDIPPPTDDDFPVFGKAYRDLDSDEYATATSIAMERHFALNWLCGYSSNWDETPTDT